MLTMKVHYDHKHNKRDDASLRVCGVGYVSAENEWAFSSHKHDDLVELILIVNGRGKLSVNNRSFDTKKGDLLIFNEGLQHEEKSRAEDPIAHFVIQLTGVKLDGLPINRVLPDAAAPVIQTGDSFGVLHHLFQHIKQQCIEKKTGFEIAVYDMARAVLSIVTQLLLEEQRILEPQESSFPAIQRITSYLDIHYSEPITLEKLSQIFHFSTFYIARKFKDETGYTINQYIANRRMGEAERLLVYEEISIKEIAAKTGFRNLNYFYNTFKKYTGCSPSQFRDMYNKH